MRVLVVDDEAALLMTLAANLELEGFDVVEASSASAALDQLGHGTFDLVLSDIRMPGMSGIDLYRKIRERGVDLPVVLMTAFEVEGLVHAAIEEGVFTVLPKPFAIERAVRTLRRAAERPFVLVVDDAASVAETTAEALTASGVRAKAVHSGLAAVDAVRAGDIDVCVVDIVMSGLDGVETIRRIREVDLSIGCLAVSGRDVQDLLRAVAALGGVACMRKPLPIPELVRAIASARSAASSS